MAASHAPHEIPIEHEPADSWHHHDLGAEGMPQREHSSVANPLALFITFVALSVVTLALVGIVQMYYFQQVSGVGGLAARQDKEATLRMAAESQLYSQESERRLGTYEWVDAKAGTISIPIEAAFDRVIDSYAPDSKAGGR